MATANRTCQVCGAEAWRAYYRVFPMWLCSDETCGHVWGFWSWVLNFHFDGQFQVKEQ